MDAKFAQDAADAGNEIARENQRIRSARITQNRQFESWDGLIRTPAFQEFTEARGLEIRSIDESLPRVPEAEAACLGAMLIATDAALYGVSNLRPSCFAYEHDRRVLTGIAMAAKRVKRQELDEVDIVTVAGEIRRSGQWMDGMGEYMKGLIESCPSSGNIARYVAQVLECSRLRCQIEMSEMVRLAVQRGAPPGQIANATRNALDAIEQRGFCDLKAVFESCK